MGASLPHDESPDSPPPSQALGAPPHRLLERAHQLLRVGGWEYVPATDTLRWTEAMYALFDLAPDHTPQLTTFVQFCDSDVQPDLRRALTRALDAGTPFDLEVPFVTARGRPRWGRVICEPRGDSDGTVTHLLGTLQDITPYKEAEEALADERDLLDRIMATSALAITVVDTTGRVVFANDRAAAVLRTSSQHPDRAALQGTPYLPPTWTVTTLDGTPVAPDALIHRRVVREGTAVLDVTYTIRDADGDERVLAMSGAPLTDDAGRVVRVVVTIADITQSHHVRAALEQSEARFNGLLQSLNDVVWESDREGTTLFYVNDAVESMYGFSSGEFHDNPWLWREQIHPADRDRVEERLDTIEETGAVTFEHRIVRPDGSIRWLQSFVSLIANDDGPPHLGGLSTDITERKVASDAIRKEREFLNTLLDQMHAGVVACDAEGRITVFNRTTRRWHGLPPTPVPPEHWPEYYSLYRADGSTPLPPDEVPLRRALRGETVQAAEMVIAPEDGLPRTVECNGRPIRDPDGQLTGAVVVMHDVTMRRKLETQLYHQAFHDALTDLPNRKHFAERCRDAIDRFTRRDVAYAVLYLDLDRFKSVNDSLGHHVGDALLQCVADRIQANLRGDDFVARLGGDEFAILVQPAHDSDHVLGIAHRITAALEAPFHLKDTAVHTAASIGIVMGAPRHHQPNDVLREADLAMYRAKEQADGPLFFDPHLDENVRSQFFLEADLHRALQRDELRAFYQPIIRLADGALAGFEALVRWQHPERGLLAPNAFLDVAERSGLITDMDRWMMDTVLRQARQWRRTIDPAPEVLLHVNCSYHTFRDDSLSAYMRARLAQTQTAPSHLALEITERELVDDLGRVIDEMQQVKAHGVHLCIDDFGVKYSSLGVLQRLPVDTVKVDRSFVQHIDGSDANQTMVEAMADIAHRMDLALVAEGIETPEHLRVLRALGYQSGQGYLFARPLDAEAATACLRGDQPWRRFWTQAPSSATPLT